MQKYLSGLVLVMILLSACGDRVENPFASGSSAESDTLPEVLSTTPGDGFTLFPVDSRIYVTFNKSMDPATITTNSSDTICSGTFQVSSDGFNTCIRMSSAPVPYNGDMTFEIMPAADLNISTLYRIRVATSAQDTGGNSLGEEYTSPNGFTTADSPDLISPSVLMVIPDDGESLVPVNAPVYVTFNEVMDPLTVTTNISDTLCSGTFQVSRFTDNFAAGTCVQMINDPQPENGNVTFSIVPFGNLVPDTTYLIRVTTGVTDLYGNPLDSLFTLPVGFTTASTNDGTPPQVVYTDPVNGATAVPQDTKIIVRFNEAMDPSTITTTTDAASALGCSGSFLVSTDFNFTSNCVVMSGPPVASVANKIYTIQPALLLSSTTYYIRIRTASVTDSAGNPVGGTDYQNVFSTF